MTDTPEWLSLGDSSSERFMDTRLQVHHATQALAAFGQNFLKGRPDDSHRSMVWDPVEERFWSDASADGARAAVSFNPLEVHVVAGDGRSTSLPLMGITLVTLRAWLERAVPEVTGWDPAELSWPEYDMPDHPVVSGRPFEPHPGAQRSLAAWYSNATALIRHTVEAAGPGQASPIRVWPHHFDIASLVTVEHAEDENAAKSIGVGLSPGDVNYDEPYLYVTPWPHSDAEDLPDFEQPGYWHTENWVGLVLRASEIGTMGDAADQAGGTSSFMSRAFRVAQDMVSQA